MPMMLEIITAERQVYSDEVDMVIAPGFDGQLGILPRHAPLMTMLKPGELTVRKNGEDFSAASLRSCPANTTTCLSRRSTW